MKAPVWGAAADGTEVTVQIQGKSASATATNGKWLVHLPPLTADEGTTLTITGGGQSQVIKDVAVGEVWFCSGQSNMGLLLRDATGGDNAIANSADPHLRYFRTLYRASDDPLPLEGGSWVKSGSETARSFSAVAYFFAKELRSELGVPVGIIVSELGGTTIDAWTSRAILAEETPWVLKSWESTKQSLARNHPDMPTPPNVQYHKGSFTALNDLEIRYFKGPGRLFGGMVYGIAPYAVRGVVWYQGESDQGQAHSYRSRFPKMIRDWRQHWKREDLPFLFVMLPGYGMPTQGYTYELRDAQFHTLRTVPNTGMAIGVDLGDEREVHPPNKLPLALRISRLALSKLYGFRLTPTGPLYRSVTFANGEATVEFDHAESGLAVKGAALHGFLIAGADQVFHPATARIVNEQRVVVRSTEAPQPVAVRYAWTNTPTLTLWTTEGLPAAPFRTDEFPLITNWQRK
jgi:sialate O-acetylesterase